MRKGVTAIACAAMLQHDILSHLQNNNAILIALVRYGTDNVYTIPITGMQTGKDRPHNTVMRGRVVQERLETTYGSALHTEAQA